MIPRYTPDDVGALWTDAHKLKVWLDVELAVTAEMAAIGLVSADELEHLSKVAAVVDHVALAARALEIEKTTHHDVIAFLSAFEELAGPASRHVHYGLTSSDVVDTGLAIVLGEATDLILRDIEVLRTSVKARAIEHRRTPMMGRTHGIHAEPQTFGLVLAGWYAELGRNAVRVRAARASIRSGKLSGAVGTSAYLDRYDP